MRVLKLILLLLIAISIIQCSKDDQIIENTEITNLGDPTNVSFLIKVVNKQGNLLTDYQLIDNHNGTTHTPDENGLVLLENINTPFDGLPIVLKKQGMMDLVRILEGATGSRKTVELTMYPFDMQSEIATGNSGTISGGGTLTLPATLLRPDGSTYTGNVLVRSHYYDPTSSTFPQEVPGDMTAIGQNGERYTLQSFGMYNIELFDNAGNELTIPDGQTAGIEFPIPSNLASDAPSEIPLWSLDEATGKWMEEGIATKNGLLYQAEVSHFSWWNCDIPFTPIEVCMNLVDLTELPIANQTYLVSSPDLTIPYSFGVTDQDGKLCTSVPEGLPVVIRIFVEGQYSDPVSLGSFMEYTDLGTVSMNLAFFHLTGSAKDCSGNALSNIIVQANINGVNDFMLTDNSGLFDYLFFEQGTIKTKLFNTEQNRTSEEITTMITTDQLIYDLGDIPLCDDLNPDDFTFVTSDITTNTTWQTGTVYTLLGKIVVEPGVTLTIEPGVIVKADVGQGGNASWLVVARGAKILAEGTANSPIIFTSITDEIQPGMIVSPNLTPADRGLWGGLAILGNARISASDSNDEDVSEVSVEGLLPFDLNDIYGGMDNADNSGVLRYVSIRHAGTNIGLGNQIDGLLLAGVGSQTVIDQVEVVAGFDDGVSWYGGAVNVSNLVTWSCGDDGIDTDQAWSGTLDNFAVITPNRTCFELDGPEGSYNATHTIQNGSILASNGMTVSQDLINVDTNSMVNLKNLYFTSIFYNFDNLQGQVVEGTDGSAPEVTFENILLNISEGTLDQYCEGGIVPAGISTGNTPQADVSVFNWTWTANAGMLDDL